MINATSATPKTRIENRRGELDALIEALLAAHRELIAVARADYERENGPVAGPGELLGLLTEHESFAWLHPLSSFVAEIEAALDDDAIAAAFIDARRLFEPGSGPFAAAYYDALQRSPEAVMAHAALRDKLR